MYSTYSDYINWLLDLMQSYNISRKDLTAISLVGFTTHTLADINETVSFNSRQAIKESHVITAQKLDSLYKHAREVDIFPTLSIPAQMDFILIINADDFDEVADTTPQYKKYIIDKSNYIMVGGFIYSFDYDLEIYIENKPNHEDIGYMHARYRNDDGLDYLPEELQTIKNPTIKVTKTNTRLIKRKTNRGWEYHLYLRLKQYAREVHEREFQDRDYSAFNYTANGELVNVKAYRIRAKVEDGLEPITPLDVKMYFEGSRTSKDSIFMQFESPNSFTMIHKSQENGFRPFTNDKLQTHIFTTAGSAGNFRYSKTMGDDIKFINNDNSLLDIQVALPDGISSGGQSYTNNKEDLRRDIITRKSTRDCIITENDLEMHIKHRARSNDHYIIKTRNDIKRIFNVFTALKYRADSTHDYYIPTNTLDIDWKLGETADMDLSLSQEERFYNSGTFMVKYVKTGESSNYAEIINPTLNDLLEPLMQEFKLGLIDPVFTDDGRNLIVDEKTLIPVITGDLREIEAGKTYYYDKALYTATKTQTGLTDDQAIASLVSNNFDSNGTDILFNKNDALYYWLPYYIVYVRSQYKNFVKIYEQTMDKKYDLDYYLDDKDAPYSFICNWARFSKPSIFNEYNVNINVRNNLTGKTLLDDGFLLQLSNGRSLDTGKLQVFLVLKDSEGVEVYADRFSINEYNVVPEEDDDWIDYGLTMIPAGYIPKIIDDKIALWSSLHDEWFQVPITGLKAEIRAYNYPDAEVGDPNIDIILDTLPGEELDEPIKIYKDADYRSDKYLVNHYTSDCDILTDLTELFKLQHNVITPEHIRLLRVPVVQYTFYKNFAYLYHAALKEEYDILDYVHKFQGEFSLALKFVNTYGYSRYYKIGLDQKPLNNVQLDISMLVKPTLDESNLQLKELSYAVAKYVESIDFVKLETFHASKLYDHLYDNYRGKIDLIEFREMNGKLRDNQLIGMTIDRTRSDTIIEKINVPYRYTDEFEYMIGWKVIAPEAKK